MISAEVTLNVQRNCGTVIANYIRNMAMNSYSLQPIAIAGSHITTLNMGDGFVENTTQIINNIYDANFENLDLNNALASINISDKQTLYVFEFRGDSEITFEQSKLATLLSPKSLKIIFLNSFGVKTTKDNKQLIDEYLNKLGITENVVEFSSRHCPVQSYMFNVDTSIDDEELERLIITYKCTTEIIDQLIVDLDSVKQVQFLSKKP